MIVEWFLKIKSRMIRFIEKPDLKPYNTFNLHAKADYFFEFTEAEELLVFLENNRLPESKFILGGGSNVLFCNDFQGIVLHPNIPGIFVVKEDRNHVFLEVGAGTEWDSLVEYAVNFGLGGLENLSAIPGKVGASPVQNIGAYGAEAKNCITLVHGVDLVNNQSIVFTNEECRFGYRDSVFKNDLNGSVVITSVQFKLDKFPEFNVDYGDVKAEAERLGGINLRNIRSAIVSIRGSKLPDTKLLGNAGSFFKNPVVEEAMVADLQKVYPNIPVYTSSDAGKLKLAAGWLIEKCGWKGVRKGDAGVHDKQALVLVNHGNATGKDIYQLSEEIIRSVANSFHIVLEREVNIL
jgi:UDP-N-acetylmuramate dehydrogenase